MARIVKAEQTAGRAGRGGARRPRIGAMDSTFALLRSCLLAAAGLAFGLAAPAQGVPGAPARPASAVVASAADAPIDAREPAEPNVKRSVIEDEGSRIEELRVRGQPQRIVVTPKVGTKKSYEIIPDSSGREMFDGSGASRGAVGKRVWNVFDF
jgi:hypothetical protein